MAEHESLIGRVADEEKVGALASVGVFLAHLVDETTRSLAGDHELVALCPVATL